MAISLLFWFMTGTTAASESDKASNYDQIFQKYTEKFFGPEFDWQFFKSQGVIESRLRQHAKSHRGAKGIMQLMPATYQEIQKKNTYFRKKQMDEAQTNIGAGIFYDFYLYQRWKNKPVSPDLRLNLMLASYNGGYSRVLKAFNKAGKPEHDWEAIAAHLPSETRNYVKRIIKHYEKQQSILLTKHSDREGCWISPVVAQPVC